MFFRGRSEIVADFGCGEAVIAQSVQNTVYSFDLVAKNKHVMACNMAKVGASKQSDSSMCVYVFLFVGKYRFINFQTLNFGFYVSLYLCNLNYYMKVIWY